MKYKLLCPSGARIEINTQSDKESWPEIDSILSNHPRGTKLTYSKLEEVNRAIYLDSNGTRRMELN